MGGGSAAGSIKFDLQGLIGHHGALVERVMDGSSAWQRLNAGIQEAASHREPGDGNCWLVRRCFHGRLTRVEGTIERFVERGERRGRVGADGAILRAPREASTNFNTKALLPHIILLDQCWVDG